MAAPHIAGLAAYLMGKGASASGLCEKMAQDGNKKVLSGIPSGTANVLAFNGNPKGRF